MADEEKYTAHSLRSSVAELIRLAEQRGDTTMAKALKAVSNPLLELLKDIPVPSHLAVPEKPVNLSAEAARLSVLPADRRSFAHISPAYAMGWGDPPRRPQDAMGTFGPSITT